MKETIASVLGVQVSVSSLSSACEQILKWTRGGRSNLVTVTGAHGLVECQRDETLRRIHNDADMVTADGMPVVWMSRLLGHRQAERVYGPDLMAGVLRGSEGTGVRHFLYGGLPEALDELRVAIARDYPGVIVAGSHSPPIRDIGAVESSEVIDQINAAEPDIVWVGLSTPKQEYWMANHIESLRPCTLIGVGAAFDFIAGRKRQAPAVLRRNGLEWLYRLLTEPRRLAGRYLQIVPWFLCLSALQLSGLKTWDSGEEYQAGADEG